jgi:hypothetical protein
MSRHCPVCQKQFEPAESPSLPFCSERCRLIDLGRWLNEGYGMPIEREDAGEEPSGDAEQP